MDYPRLVESRMPIGSGVTEAACKVLVKQRLCGSGMKRKEPGAAAVLRYPSYGPHLEGHGTIPSDRSVRSEGASSWRSAVASDVTPPGRSSGGGRSEIRSGAGSRL